MYTRCTASKNDDFVLVLALWHCVALCRMLFLFNECPVVDQRACAVRCGAVRHVALQPNFFPDFEISAVAPPTPQPTPKKKRGV